MVDYYVGKFVDFLFATGIHPWHYLTIFQVLLFFSHWKYIKNWDNTSNIIKGWITAVGYGAFLFIAVSIIIILYPKK